MSTISESGHAKNVANSEQLISFCVTLGPVFAPSNPNHRIPQLQAMQANARNCMAGLAVVTTAYNTAVNNRRITFAVLNKVATRIVSALGALHVNQETLDDARGYLRKIKGIRAAKLPKVPAAKPGSDATASIPSEKHISSSQSSYDQKLEHFTRLISVAAALPGYDPNEADLKVAALNALLAELRSANTAVFDAYSAITSARIARNKIFYQPITGLVDTALDVKLYIKSVFGPSSPEYKVVNHLRFRNVNL